jgi:ADP-heptose:LPS heptosyltransferase
MNSPNIVLPVLQRPQAVPEESAELKQLQTAIRIFKRTPPTSGGFPGVRPRDCRKVTEGLREYLERHHRLFANHDPVVPEQFLELMDRFADSDIRAYPNEYAQLELVRIEALILAGRDDDAIALSAPAAARPYLVEDDPSSLSKLFQLDIQARFNSGRHAEVEAVAMGRLLFLTRVQPHAARQLFTRFFPMIATTRVFATQHRLAESLVRFAARFRLYLLLRKKRQVLFLRGLEWPLRWIGIWTLRYLASRRQSLRLQVLDGPLTPPPRKPGFAMRLAGLLGFRSDSAGDILVTRAMGGLGDIIMMTPGLKALAKRIGRPVHFATKRQFFPLLENNPDVRLIDVDEIIEVHGYRRWVNLSLCPAGRYESRRVPKVKKGRVELFARAMGIRKRSLDQSGSKPVFHLSGEQLRQRELYRAQFRAGMLPVIAVQPFSRDSYKNCPGLLDAVTELAEKARIVLLHTSPVPVPAHPNIIQLHGRPMRDTFAAIAACDYFVSVDSGFFHVAAALEIPSAGIFGPTDARIVSRHHPCAVLIEAPDGFVCSPCWRNEDLPCKLTGGQISVCLSSISAGEILAGIERLVTQYPRSPAL